MKIITTIIFLVSSIAFADTSEEVRLMKEMISVIKQNQKEITPPSGNVFSESGEPRKGVPRGFEGLSDTEKTRMVSSYLLAYNAVTPYARDPWLRALLETFPDSIRDDSEFRRLLANEEDAKKFHILKINLLRYFVVRDGNSFIAEMAHMLLRDEPVVDIGRHRPGEWDDPTFYDVSKGTYITIMSSLKRLNASFEDPPDDIPHEQRKLILARWLKENWPGCEDLALPGAGRAVKGGQARPELPAPPVASTSGPGDGEIKEDPGKSPPRWAWVSVLAILAAALVAWFRSRPAKT